jgi:biopolymer transport protein ExbB
MFGGENAWQVLIHGGITVLVLIVCSVLSWVVIVERWLKFKRAENASERLAARVCKLARADQASEARQLTQAEEGLIAQLLQAGLGHPTRDKKVLEEALERKSAELLLDLERRISILGTLSGVAPFVGLFGTVLGIIHAFRALATSGQTAGAAVVSAGIAEALVATAMGLAVAVPALIFYNIFVRRANVLDIKMAMASSQLVEALYDKTQSKRSSDEEA